MKADHHVRPIDRLLSRLEGCKHEGKGYRAPCPACGGVSRKLAIAEAPGGAVLLHCFGGCQPACVLAAVGLRLGELFPVRLASPTAGDQREARQHARLAYWQAAMEVMPTEVAIAHLAAAQIARGQPLDELDYERFTQAAERIANALNVLCPHLGRFRPKASP